MLHFRMETERNECVKLIKKMFANHSVFCLPALYVKKGDIHLCIYVTSFDLGLEYVKGELAYCGFIESNILDPKTRTIERIGNKGTKLTSYMQDVYDRFPDGAYIYQGILEGQECVVADYHNVIFNECDKSAEEILLYPKAKKVQLKHIKKTVAEYFDLSIKQICERSYITPRQIAILLTDEFADMERKHIGEKFGYISNFVTFSSLEAMKTKLTENRYYLYDYENIRQILLGNKNIKNVRRLNVEIIRNIIANHYDVNADILTDSKTKEPSQLVEYWKIYSYFLNECTHLSLKKIGDVFGKKGSAVFTAYESFKEKLFSIREKYGTLQNDIKAISDKLNAYLEQKLIA